MEEEFRNHPSITSISSQNFNLAFSFQRVSVEYMGKLLSKLKINKSCGPDNIPPKILKSVSASTIKEPLTKLINYCITESSWPLNWKRSHITPVFKKDDASSVKNYRPISILSAIPKLLVYAKIGVLRRLKRLIPCNVSLSLYKAYLLPHLEYCSPLLIGINKILNSKLESANKYAHKTLLNLGNNLDYDTILSLSDMQSLEHRRYYSSLVLLYKCMNSNGPQYIGNFFQTRYTKYNIRDRGINLEQSGYNNKFFHNSFTYIVSRLWNKLPAHIKTSSLVTSLVT